MKSTRLTGLIAAPFTPFDADHSLKLEVVPLFARHLVKQKVKGAFVGGTTGEWASMTQDERRALAEAWRGAAGSELSLIVHVGHNCLAESRDLARHAESLEADAIAAIMPSFFRSATLAELVEYCRQIARAAPRTPFYYYHFPDMTGVDFNMDQFVGAAGRSIPTFRGIKYTHGDMLDYGLTRDAGGTRYDILFGRDEYLLAALAFGATGAVGSTYNYCARMHYRMMQSYAAGQGEKARKLEVAIQRVIRILQKYGGGIGAGKAVLAMVGVDCGPCRLPLSSLTARQTAGLRRDLQSLDFFAQVKA